MNIARLPVLVIFVQCTAPLLGSSYFRTSHHAGQQLSDLHTSLRLYLPILFPPIFHLMGCRSSMHSEVFPCVFWLLFPFFLADIKDNNFSERLSLSQGLLCEVLNWHKLPYVRVLIIVIIYYPPLWCRSLTVVCFKFWWVYSFFIFLFFYFE